MSEETTSPQAELPVPETPAPEVPVVKRKRIVKAQAEEVQHEVIIKEDGEVPKSNLVEIEVDPASIAPKVDIAGCYGDSEEEDLGIKTGMTGVPLRKPPQKDCWFTILHELKYPVLVITSSENNKGQDIWLVHKSQYKAVTDEACAAKYILYICVGINGQPFIWYTKKPNPDDNATAWLGSAVMCAEVGKKNWVRVFSDKGAAKYVYRISTKYPPPNPLEFTIDELLQEAFKGKVIDRPDHPVLMHLRGE